MIQGGDFSEGITLDFFRWIMYILCAVTFDRNVCLNRKWQRWRIYIWRILWRWVSFFQFIRLYLSIIMLISIFCLFVSRWKLLNETYQGVPAVNGKQRKRHQWLTVLYVSPTYRLLQTSLLSSWIMDDNLQLSLSFFFSALMLNKCICPQCTGLVLNELWFADDNDLDWFMMCINHCFCVR